MSHLFSIKIKKAEGFLYNVNNHLYEDVFEYRFFHRYQEFVQFPVILILKRYSSRYLRDSITHLLTSFYCYCATLNFHFF